MPGVSPPDRAAVELPRPLHTGASFAWGLFFAAASLLVGPIHLLVALLVLALGAGLIAHDVRRRQIGDASQLLAASFRAVSVGRLADADAFLDVADKSRLAWSRRIADVQRAMVHLRRGDTKQALGRLDAAIARPIGRYARENATYQIEAAHALRAFTRASLGDAEGARRDIAAVRERRGVSAESLARASLAEAVPVADPPHIADTADEDKNGRPIAKPLLAVTRLPPGAVCHIAYVDVKANPDATSSEPTPAPATSKITSRPTCRPAMVARVRRTP